MEEDARCLFIKLVGRLTRWSKQNEMIFVGNGHLDNKSCTCSLVSESVWKSCVFLRPDARARVHATFPNASESDIR